MVISKYQRFSVQELCFCISITYEGLKINSNKTKSLEIQEMRLYGLKYISVYVIIIKVVDITVEQVSNFSYFGAVISADGTLE